MASTAIANGPQSGNHATSKQLAIRMQNYRKRQPLQKTSTVSSQAD